LIANISGTDQAIDKRKMASSTIIIPTFDENECELWSIKGKMTLSS